MKLKDRYYEIFAEIGFKKEFWTENSRFISQGDEVLHDTNEADLLHFIKKQNL